jgi:hypothetical protein|tara:strand:- start:485 stop:769 length:285 start_codon:yes stop_codon:yes gene_type:complete
MIYIATDIHGRGVRHVTAFEDRLDLWAYADEVLSCHSVSPNRSDSIDVLCDKLYDNGIGTGARSHRRVSRMAAAMLIRGGAKASGCWNLVPEAA